MVGPVPGAGRNFNVKLTLNIMRERVILREASKLDDMECEDIAQQSGSGAVAAVDEGARVVMEHLAAPLSEEYIRDSEGCGVQLSQYDCEKPLQ